VSKTLCALTLRDLLGANFVPDGTSETTARPAWSRSEGQLSSGRRRPRVPLRDSGRATYSTYATDELAAERKMGGSSPIFSRQVSESKSTMQSGVVRCDERIAGLQEARLACRSCRICR